MTTQLFKAKDVRSAIGLVTEEFGDDAIILSTKNNNGIVLMMSPCTDKFGYF